jgi:hypothetical protein
MIHDAVFNTNSPNLVFWVSIVVDIQTVSIAVASAGVFIGSYLLHVADQAPDQDQTNGIYHENAL